MEEKSKLELDKIQKKKEWTTESHIRYTEFGYTRQRNIRQTPTEVAKGQRPKNPLKSVCESEWVVGQIYYYIW